MSVRVPGPEVPAASTVEEGGDGVFAYVQPDGSWMINNTGSLVGRDGVSAIDACATERRTRMLLAAIREVSAAPVRTLVNTHHHPDHTGGNGLFAGATIVAHENARPETRALGLPHNNGIWTDVDYGDVELALPFLTFADRLTLWADEVRCELRYAGGPAHTTNDVVVWIPEQSVLFAGDLLFNGGTPFLLSGSVLGAIDVLEQIVRPLGARTIVPGHGPVAGPELIDEVLACLRFVRDLAVEGRTAGASPLELARGTDLGRFAEWSDAERIVGNLHRAYLALARAALGGSRASATSGDRGDPCRSRCRRVLPRWRADRGDGACRRIPGEPRPASVDAALGAATPPVRRGHPPVTCRRRARGDVWRRAGWRWASSHGAQHSRTPVQEVSCAALRHPAAGLSTRR
ncbi:MBL fold metallo-hydrolase [Geodermatophilus sp. SYSU D00742]